MIQISQSSSSEYSSASSAFLKWAPCAAAEAVGFGLITTELDAAEVVPATGRAVEVVVVVLFAAAVVAPGKGGAGSGLRATIGLGSAAGVISAGIRPAPADTFGFTSTAVSCFFDCYC